MTHCFNEEVINFPKEVQEKWHQDYMEEFEKLACSDEFPCIYVKQGYKKGFLSFHFIDNPNDETDRKNVFNAMKEYVADVLATSDNLTAAMKILLIVVNNRAITGSHEEMAWTLLNDFVQRDEVPWPEHITQNPDDESWAYCFQGQRLFVNISSPEHKLRRSRNIGEHLVLVVQLRDGIDYIAPPNEKGDSIRSFIRQRINSYDAVPVSKDLATHGQGQNRDWKQFWLGDRDEVYQSTCPFHQPKITADIDEGNA